MSTSKPQPLVLLIHGLGAHWLVMSLLERRLKQRGFRVHNWGYWSIGATIEHHAEAFRQTLREIDQDPEVSELYLVTHSMGGIVARTALSQFKPEKLHRMVMLAPPNRGSPWATVLGPWVRPVCQTLGQLAEHPDSFVNQLPIPEGIEFGVIAAGGDLLVREEATHLPNQRDHITVSALMHSGVLFSTVVVDQILNFFKEGQFHRAEYASAG